MAWINIVNEKRAVSSIYLTTVVELTYNQNELLDEKNYKYCRIAI